MSYNSSIMPPRLGDTAFLEQSRRVDRSAFPNAEQLFVALVLAGYYLKASFWPFLPITTMKLSTVLLAAAAASGVMADDTSLTITMTFTDNDRTYTKTRTDLYTGQETTLPTDGIHTTTFTLTDDDWTATVEQTNTYGKDTIVTSLDIIYGPEETYTRETTLQMHETQVSSYLSWLSVKNELAQSAIDGETDRLYLPEEVETTSTTTSAAQTTSADTTSATGGAVKYGVGGAAMGIAAVMLL